MENSNDTEIAKNPVLLATESAHRQYRNGVMLAASLLSRDYIKIIALSPLLFTCSVITHFLTPLTYQSLIILTIIERTGCSLFFFLVARKWVREFTSSISLPGLLSFLRLLAINLTLWFLISLASIFQTIQQSFNLQLIYLIIIIPLLGFFLQYYFYFMPILLGVRSWRDILQESMTYMYFHRSLPVKLVVGPLVLSTFVVSLIHMIAPDGRYLSVLIAMDIAESLFWIFNTYLSIGVGFSILANRVHIPVIHPYLKSRLDTLSAFAPDFLTTVISPANGLKFGIVAALILYANLVRLWDTPPAPILNIQSVEVQDKNVTLSLNAEDEAFMFRGFNPSLFHIAGETGEPISNKSPSVTINGRSVDILMPFSSKESTASLNMKFALINRAEDIKALKDVYLWYGQVKLMHLSPYIK